jgi:molybdopterin/thiamine biosynthesis adenylyltransferase
MAQNEIFSRNILFYSKEKFNIIKDSKIAIAGVGGLGCVVAEILSRMGVSLILIDSGIVDEPDLGRQSLYGIDDVGKRKIDAAKESLFRKTGFDNTETIFADITKEDLSKNLNKADGIVDCLDNYKSRFALENYLSESQFLIHGGVEDDFGQITTIQKGITPKLADIYKGVGEKNGIISVSTDSVFAIASLMAKETINNILKKPQLINKMLVVELEDFSFIKIDLK